MGNLQLKWSILGLVWGAMARSLGIPQMRECVSIFNDFSYFILIFCTSLGFKVGKKMGSDLCPLLVLS